MKQLIKTFFLLIAVIVIINCKQPKNQNKKQEITAEMASTIAKDAYLFGLPLVLIEKQFDVNTSVTTPTGLKAPVNQFGHSREFVDASNRQVVGFNVDNLYSFGNLDLFKEPIILSVPDMGDRYWIMQLVDAWNGVPAAPGSRTHGSGARSFVITGPNWNGDLPKGMEELKSPTNITMIATRTYCRGKEEYNIVNKLQDQFTLTPLSKWGSEFTPPALVPLREGVDGTTLVNQQVMMLSPEQFYQNLNRLLVNNPAYPADSDALKRFQRLGISPGAEFSLDNFSADIKEAISLGFKAGQGELMANLKTLGESRNGWTLTYNMGRFGTNYPNRAAWTFIGIGGNILEDAFYPTAIIDDEGKPLHGGNKYTLRFTKSEIPQAKAFWSMTMYDTDGYLVPNELNRYAIGDISDIAYAEDGSLTIYIQNENPGRGKEDNWLPAPEEAFRMALRLYVPSENVINGRWIPPAVKRVD